MEWGVHDRALHAWDSRFFGGISCSARWQPRSHERGYMTALRHSSARRGWRQRIFVRSRSMAYRLEPVGTRSSRRVCDSAPASVTTTRV